MEIEARALLSIGLVYKEKNDTDEAQKFFKKALGIAQAAGFKPLIEDIQKELNGIGKIERK